MMDLSLLKKRLAAYIQNSKAHNDDPNKADWDYKEGVLLTCADAEQLLALIDPPKPEPSFEERWAEIQNNFDFYRVKRAMDALDWTWGVNVPSIGRTRESAKDTARTAWEKGNCKAGGFSAVRDGDSLELSFVVESWEAGSVNDEGNE